MNSIIDKINKIEQYIALKEKLSSKNNINNISTIGLTDSAKAMFVYNLSKSLNKSSVIVCNNVYQANKLIQDLKFFDSDIEILFLPSKSIEYYDIEAESNEIESQRSYVIQKILSKEINIVVTTIDSLLLNMRPKDSFNKLDLSIDMGKKIEVEKFINSLVELGYERSEIAEGKGQFAIRGGIIDIYATNNELPYRIELFGDEVDNIRTFDPVTQRSIDTLKKINISYAKTNYISRNKVDEIINSLKKLVDSNEINSELKLNIMKDIEKLENGSLENVFDKYFEFFKESCQTLLDYVEDYMIFIDEPLKCIEKSKNVVYENEESLKVFASRNSIYLPYVNKYLKYEDILIKLSKMKNVYMERICLDNNLHNRKTVL